MADLKGIVKYYDLKKSNTPKTKVNRIALNYKSKTVKKNSFVKLTAYVTPSTAIQNQSPGALIIKRWQRWTKVD